MPCVCEVQNVFLHSYSSRFYFTKAGMLYKRLYYYGCFNLTTKCESKFVITKAVKTSVLM